ncbi:MAG: NifB/NifX family molybdenum-iron cluster-binding protein [Anaerolineaceae bacterium]|jgi:predicted Fe-Mo cluster-binding NifX family protein|nr:NifB/NifX family molybdenum-iron cluster-binding protein [Anaerolineaceae bacterium]
MILMISSQGQDLTSPIEARFGRCPWLIKYNTDTKGSEALANPGLRQSGGAGVAAAQFVIDQGADVVISGDFGPNAANALGASNIAMIKFPADVSQINDVIELFHQGKLNL